MLRYFLRNSENNDTHGEMKAVKEVRRGEEEGGDERSKSQVDWQTENMELRKRTYK